jgi:hypothetical protein
LELWNFAIDLEPDKFVSKIMPPSIKGFVEHANQGVETMLTDNNTMVLATFHTLYNMDKCAEWE